MLKWIRDLDRVLRGEATRSLTPSDATLDIPIAGLSVVIFALAMLYGICMGCYALFRPDGPVPMQMVASAIKVPALFFLTLVITFPSLYVFNALVGSRLNILALLRLLIAALGVNITVLASLGPILAFFSLSTRSYPFMVLLNVILFATSGGLGLAFLLRTLHRLTASPAPPRMDQNVSPPAMSLSPDISASDVLPGNSAAVASAPSRVMPGHTRSSQVRLLFNCWIVIFGLVGAQMGWVLRPFIGAPGKEFVWFRERESNFFEAVVNLIRHFLS